MTLYRQAREHDLLAARLLLAARRGEDSVEGQAGALLEVEHMRHARAAHEILVGLVKGLSG